MNKPLVSIIIPVYNGANYLEECINSALDQTYENIEIIVINDGSNDDGATEEIALRFGSKIKYFYKTNGGVSSALNMGISVMKGQWFSWLSHDDLYNPNKIEKQMHIIRKKQLGKNVICLSNSQLIDHKGETAFSFRCVRQGLVNNHKMFKSLLFKYTINGCSLLIHRSIFAKYGGFDESFVFIQDLAYWINLSLHGYDFYIISEKLVKHRVHQNQVSVKKSHIRNPELIQFLSNLVDSLNPTNEIHFKTLKVLYLFSYYSNSKKLYFAVVNQIKKTEQRMLSLKLFGFYYRFKGMLHRFIRNLFHKLFR